MKCVTCKGRGLCGRPVCPILRRLEEVSALPKIEPSVFPLISKDTYQKKYISS
jgi:hypothetical protein